MKKNIIYLIISILGSTGMCQSLSEAIIGNGAVKGERIIIRAYTTKSDTISVMYNYDFNMSDGENRFTIRNLITDATVTFKIPDVYTLGGTPFPQPHNPNDGQEMYRIHDMKIFEGMCYFCGEKQTTTGYLVYDTSGNLTYETDNVGFVGKFSIAGIMGGNPSSFVYTLINEVKSLKRMIVYYATQGLAISMVGQPKYVPYSTCLVDLYSTPSGWEYDVSHSTDVNEHITDITYSNSIVATVSKINNDHYGFVIRYSKSDNILTSSSCIHNAHIFSAYNATMVSDPDVLPTYRDELDPLFLCPDEMSSGFFVAHACSTAHYGIAAYRMKVENFCTPIINLANQYIKSDSYLALKDLAYSPNKETLYSLTERKSDNTTGINLQSFTNTVDYTDYWFNHTSKHYQSFDILNVNRLLFGGKYFNNDHIFQSHNFLYHLYHLYPFPLQIFSPCISTHDNQIFILNTLDTSVEIIPMTSICDDESAIWDHIDIEILALTNIHPC